MPASPPTDDHLLLERFMKAKDQAAFAQLVERYLPLVYTVALRVTRQPQLAEETGQDVFLKLVQNPSAAMKGIPLAAWLHRATRCRAIDLLRAERRRMAREQAAVPVTAAEALLDEEALALLDEVIDRLPEGERRLVLGRFFLGQSFAALSAQTGATEDAVRMRTNRALEKMRQFFSRRGITTTAAILAQALPSQALTLPPRAMATAILKSAAAVGATGTGASLSLTGFIYLMTTAQKSTIAGIVLLAAAIPAVFYLSDREQDAKRDKSSTTTASASAATHSQDPSGSGGKPARTSRKELDPAYADLAAKYGEANTRRAQALASQSSSAVGEVTGLLISGGKAGDEVGARFHALSGNLRLTAEQEAALQELLPAATKTCTNQLEDLARKSKAGLPAIAEIYLATDALSRGTIARDEFDEVIRRTSPLLRTGNFHVMEYTGVVGMASRHEIPDPFAGDPENKAAFIAILDDEQKRRYEDAAKANATSAESPIIDSGDLEALSGKIAAMDKMIEAFRLTEASGKKLK